MGKRSIAVRVYPVDGEPYGKEIPMDAEGSCLHALQEVVGGNIEFFNVLDGGPDLVVNDEGLFTQAPNRAVYATRDMEEAGYLSQFTGKPVKAGEVYTVLFGPIVAVGVDEDGGTTDADRRSLEWLDSSGHLGGPGSGLFAIRCAMAHA